MSDTEEKRAVGHPTVMTEEVIQQLEAAFLLGCTDLEACLKAGISKSTLYNYQNEYPEFLERKELLKKNPTYRARVCVYQSLRLDPELALKYLERKEKNEFSPRIESTGPEGAPLGPAVVVSKDDLKEALKELKEEY